MHEVEPMPTLTSETEQALIEAARRAETWFGEPFLHEGEEPEVALAPGTTFTIISNTAATPITGRFANLPDSSEITIGSNTYQANYEGGDGNDLTLTVVP